jgi:hypothetical protein
MALSSMILLTLKPRMPQVQSELRGAMTGVDEVVEMPRRGQRGASPGRASRLAAGPGGHPARFPPAYKARCSDERLRLTELTQPDMVVLVTERHDQR